MTSSPIGHPRPAGPDVAWARRHDGNRPISWLTFEARMRAVVEAREVVEAGDEEEVVLRAARVDVASTAVELASRMQTTIACVVAPGRQSAPCACGCPATVQPRQRFASEACREDHARQARIVRGGRRKTSELQDRCWLHRRWVVEGASVREIADELTVTTEGVRVALRRTGLWQPGGRRDGAQQQVAA